jgi:hypothetical protein
VGYRLEATRGARREGSNRDQPLKEEEGDRRRPCQPQRGRVQRATLGGVGVRLQARLRGASGRPRRRRVARRGRRAAR